MILWLMLIEELMIQGKSCAELGARDAQEWLYSSGFTTG
jgi:hypothetical protein